MLPCHIVHDLLPDYIEGLTGPETAADLETHLAACPECRAEKEAMTAQLTLEKAPAPKTDFLRRLKLRKIMGAVLAALVTLFCLYGLYNMEFEVDVVNTTVLEAAIGDYFFSENLQVDVVESCPVGSKLVVFFEREGYAGHYGLAILERGVFGKYRFLSASLMDWPLYSYTVSHSLGKEHLLLCGVNDLPGVASYAVYPGDDTAKTPIYRGEAEKAPFLRIVDVPGGEEYVGSHFVHYYDSAGVELDISQLCQTVPVPVDASTPGVGTAELGLVYFFMAVILVLGVVVIRYFLIP